MAEDDVVPPDTRDEALARALEVAPLDELTLRRLVHGALTSTRSLDPPSAAPPAGGTSRARVLGVAAAVVAFVVLGVAALALPGGDTADVATRAPRALHDRVAETPEATGSPAAASAAAAPAAAPTAADASSASAEAAHAPVDLGQLGDLSAAGSRDRVVAAAQPSVGGVASQQSSLTFQSCPPRTLATVATGLGTIDGEPVQVVVSRREDGSLRVRAIDGSTCTLRSLP